MLGGIPGLVQGRISEKNLAIEFPKESRKEYQGEIKKKNAGKFRGREAFREDFWEKKNRINYGKSFKSNLNSSALNGNPGCILEIYPRAKPWEEFL